jgi:hypothetical protein
MMRQRLKMWGLDLSSQERNRYLAQIGSIKGSFATIDLSNASDTICCELVRFLLPVSWLHALELTRTTSIEYEGSFRNLHRFSSMGNGFTFELETLIFLALSYVSMGKSSRKNIAVYGDDIIVPTSDYESVCVMLTAVGFVVNKEKSFASGPFRESCGADWFLGKPVRPFYIKEVPTNVASLISMANGLKRASGRCNNHFGYCSIFRRAWLRALRGIPKCILDKLASDLSTDDSVIYSPRTRDGLKLISVTRTHQAQSLGVAIATALYRQHRRGVNRREDEARVFCHLRAQSLIRGNKTPLTYFERNHGEVTWQLATYRIDSLIRYDDEMWW